MGTKEFHGPTIFYGVLTGFLFILHFLVKESGWQSDQWFHTISEVTATILAFTVGCLALVRFYSKPNNTYLFVGAGFIGTAFLDGYHGLVTSAYFLAFNPSPPPHLLPWSWNASRIFLSVLMFLSWWAWKYEKRQGSRGLIRPATVYAAITAMTVLVFLFFTFTPLPRAYYPEYVFGRPEEFIAAFFFLLALAGYLKKGAWKNDVFERMIVASLIVSFVTQAFFMAYSHSLFDAFFDAAHILKPVSYIAIEIGLVVSMYHLFMRTERQAGELKRSNDDLEKFAYVASHDLQTPLRHVTSHVQLLDEKLKKTRDPEVHNHMEVITNGTRRMSSLIADLLRYSQIGQPVTYESVDTDRVLKGVLGDLEPEIRKLDAKILIPSGMPHVWANPAQMSQLFYNLIGNALKYHGSEQPRVTLKVEMLNGEICFQVADNGIGIDSKYAEKVFQIFQRLDKTRHVAGTGIGLAICKRIVESHGGAIWFEPNPAERGSLFKLTLPQTDRRGVLRT